MSETTKRLRSEMELNRVWYPVPHAELDALLSAAERLAQIEARVEAALVILKDARLAAGTGQTETEPYIWFTDQKIGRAQAALLPVRGAGEEG